MKYDFDVLITILFMLHSVFDDPNRIMYVNLRWWGVNLFLSKKEGGVIYVCVDFAVKFDGD